MSIRRIVVGADGSENSRRALEWAIALARAFDATVVVVHALGLLDRIGADRVATGTHRAEIVREFETSWCSPLDDAGVADERIVLDGTPADVLLAVAADRDADVVVVGARGASRRPEQVLGSTSHQVAQRATCPLLIVPPDHDA
jgi:nucleotide-binding universal stress UspA family protein